MYAFSNRGTVRRCAVIVCALVAIIPAATAHAADSRLPNIVILYADDLGFGDMSSQNPKGKIPTPHLDRLAADGLRMTDGHSSSGICTPSRYALLTGRYHWRKFHGIVGPLGGSVFSADRLTMPEMLKSKGYKTACIGKWHLGWDWNAIRKPGTKGNSHTAFDWTKRVPDGPLAHGFDHYFGDTVINFPPYCWIEDDKVVDIPDTDLKRPAQKTKEGNWECRPGPARSDWDFYQVLPTLTKKGVAYINAQKDAKQPFFLYFPLPSPHAPIIPIDAFDGKSKAGAYGDFVAQTDWSCGQLIQALKDNGLYDNTIVVFTADNGPERYAYARDQKHDHWSSAPFRGLKRDIYEGGHHVPFVIKWPGVTKAGSTSDALISQVDLMATFARLVGARDLEKDDAEDSISFLAYLKAETTTPPRTVHVHNPYAGHYAIRSGDWLLVAAKDGYVSGRSKAWEAKHRYSADDAAAVELFNIKSDPGQRKNLASKSPEKVAELTKLLASYTQHAGQKNRKGKKKK